MTLSRTRDTHADQSIKRLHRKKNRALSLLALPGICWFALFCYVPMAGLIIAFKNYNPRLGIFGSEWSGFENFRFLFLSNSAFRIVRNTLFYNFLSIFLTAAVSVAIALLMDATRSRKSLKAYQTLLFLPRFTSWVVVGYMALALFHYERGVLNQLWALFGMDPVSWYMQPDYWWMILPLANIWKTMGYTCLIYYGAILGIDTEIYEAADIDGASGAQKIWRITLPLIRPTIIIMILMSIGSIMRSDFGLFYYVPNNTGALFEATDVLDTYIYRALRVMGNTGSSAAAGFFQSVVGLITVVACNRIAKKFDEESALF